MIILLGGASGTGKSQVSYRLAARLGAALVEVDDIVVALQATTTPEQLPLLHFWDTQPHPIDPAEVVKLQIAIAEALVPAVRAVVANHRETNTPVVIEGDYLLPIAGVPTVILHEADEAQIARNYRAREPEAGDQSGRALVSRMYGDWLAERALREGAAVVAARPWSDVLERVIEEVVDGGQELGGSVDVDQVTGVDRDEPGPRDQRGRPVGGDMGA